jgi:hypothetical protein
VFTFFIGFNSVKGLIFYFTVSSGKSFVLRHHFTSDTTAKFAQTPLGAIAVPDEKSSKSVRVKQFSNDGSRPRLIYVPCKGWLQLPISVVLDLEDAPKVKPPFFKS